MIQRHTFSEAEYRGTGSPTGPADVQGNKRLLT